jgi:hypothetical protein
VNRTCALACGSGAEQRECEQFNKREQVEQVHAERGKLALHGPQPIRTGLGGKVKKWAKAKQKCDGEEACA